MTTPSTSPPGQTNGSPLQQVSVCSGECRQPIESKSSSKSSSLTPRGKQTWNALRAAGNPMPAVFVALLVLCAVLLFGVVGYMFFAPGRPRKGNAKLRGPKVTTDPDEMTEWKLPPMEKGNQAPSAVVPVTTVGGNGTGESAGPARHHAPAVQNASFKVEGEQSG
ncbi:hypothetical protein V5799_029333 [Amblyomma americanum]|uniref:Uncharacterized protein n=1 Tax=Amblyomma americanum TaxID=6943 RepID=A0AAQ4ERB3_AMBAM